MIEWIAIGLIGFIVVLLLFSPKSRKRGSKDYVLTQRTAEKAERKMERERDFVRERERRRFSRRRF